MGLNKYFPAIVIVLVALNSASLGCQSMNGISRKAVLLGLNKNSNTNEAPTTTATTILNESDDTVAVGSLGPGGFGANTRDQTKLSGKHLNLVIKHGSRNRNTNDERWEPNNKNLRVFLDTHSNNSARGKLIDLNVTFSVLKRTLETLEEIHNNNNTRIYNISSVPRPFNWSHFNATSGTSEGDRNTIQWFYPKPRNVSKPIIIQSLTKSNEYIGFKFINISSDVPNENFTLTTSKFLDESVELVEDENPGAMFMRILKFPVDPSAQKNANDTLPEQLAAELLLQQPVTLSEDDDEEIDPEEDKKVNVDWGGSCGVEHWKSCYNITVMGSRTVVHQRFPLDRKKNIKTQLDCFDTMEAKYFPWLCLRNGWTVNRCHILCMSKCNRDLLFTRKWEFFVLHEGACKTK